MNGVFTDYGRYWRFGAFGVILLVLFASIRQPELIWLALFLAIFSGGVVYLFRAGYGGEWFDVMAPLLSKLLIAVLSVGVVTVVAFTASSMIYGIAQDLGIDVRSLDAMLVTLAVPSAGLLTYVIVFPRNWRQQNSLWSTRKLAEARKRSYNDADDELPVFYGDSVYSCYVRHEATTKQYVGNVILVCLVAATILTLSALGVLLVSIVATYFEACLSIAFSVVFMIVAARFIAVACELYDVTWSKQGASIYTIDEQNNSFGL